MKQKHKEIRLNLGGVWAILILNGLETAAGTCQHVSVCTLPMLPQLPFCHGLTLHHRLQNPNYETRNGPTHLYNKELLLTNISLDAATQVNFKFVFC